MTDQEKKDARNAKREAKRNALALLIAFATDNEAPEEVMEACATLTPKRGGGGSRAKITDTVKAYLQENPEVHEDQIWEDLKLGRAEMRKACRKLIKDAEPADRVWVKGPNEDGLYTVEGTGEKAPKGWTGYRPVNTEDLDV